MRPYLLVVLLLLAFHSHSDAFPADETQSVTKDSSRSLHIGLMVLDIHKIDNLDEFIRGEFLLFMRWQDSSLLQPGQQKTLRIPVERVQIPQIQVKHLQEIESFTQRILLVAPDGTATFRHRFMGDIRQQFDFQRFPFDVQSWTITLLSPGEEALPIVPETAFLGLASADSLTLTSWEVNYLGHQRTHNTNFGFPIYGLEMKYRLKRNPEFYIWKVVIPIILVVLMSWSVFWIHPSNISAQLTVSVTAILTLIAFQFSVSQLMPPLPYLTKLDRFTIGSDIFVFIAFVETIITSYLENKGRLSTSETIDYYARFAFPIIFILFIFITFI